MPEFQPKFDYEIVPNESRLKRIPLATYHQIPWPCDDSVSLVVKDSWFNISKGWDDKLNPISGKIWFIGEGSTKYLETFEFKLEGDVRLSRKPPEGTILISVYLEPHDHAVGYSIESTPNV